MGRVPDRNCHANQWVPLEFAKQRCFQVWPLNNFTVNFGPKSFEKGDWVNANDLFTLICELTTLIREHVC